MLLALILSRSRRRALFTSRSIGTAPRYRSRLDRDQRGAFGSADYAREELVAEMASAFACASLSIQPTVRHADYIGSWLAVLREDEKAIFRVASAASRAADYLLAFAPEVA